VTITITGHDAWTVVKYVLAALGGAATVFIFMAVAAQRAFRRFWW
jgi:hypothetical protein